MSVISRFIGTAHPILAALRRLRCITTLRLVTITNGVQTEFDLTFIALRLQSARLAVAVAELGCWANELAQLSIILTMLHLMNATLRPATDPRPSPDGYFLSDVSLDISGPGAAVFRARLNGPAGSKVWARAWLSNEIDGTLAEVASDCLDAGDLVALTVKLHDGRIPENACIRIESAPLATEQVVIIKLSNQTMQPG